MARTGGDSETVRWGKMRNRGTNFKNKYQGQDGGEEGVPDIGRGKRDYNLNV